MSGTKAFFVKASSVARFEKRKKMAKREVAGVYLPIEENIKEVINGVIEEKLKNVVILCEINNKALNQTAAGLISNALFKKEIKGVNVLILDAEAFGENKLVLSQQSGGVVFKRPISTDIIIGQSSFLPDGDNSSFTALGFKEPEPDEEL